MTPHDNNNITIRCGAWKISPKEAVEIRRLVALGSSYRVVANIYKTTWQIIKLVVEGRKKDAVEESGKEASKT